MIAFVIFVVKSFLKQYSYLDREVNNIIIMLKTTITLKSFQKKHLKNISKVKSCVSINEKLTLYYYSPRLFLVLDPYTRVARSTSTASENTFFAIIRKKITDFTSLNPFIVTIKLPLILTS